MKTTPAVDADGSAGGSWSPGPGPEVVEGGDDLSCLPGFLVTSSDFLEDGSFVPGLEPASATIPAMTFGEDELSLSRPVVCSVPTSSVCLPSFGISGVIRSTFSLTRSTGD